MKLTLALAVVGSLCVGPALGQSNTYMFLDCGRDKNNIRYSRGLVSTV